MNTVYTGGNGPYAFVPGVQRLDIDELAEIIKGKIEPEIMDGVNAAIEALPPFFDDRYWNHGEALLDEGGAVLNYKAFGSIHAALAKAAENVSEGEGSAIVVVPDGEHEIKETLLVAPGVTLSLGKSAVLKAGAPITVVEVRLGGRLEGPGLIDIRGQAATGFLVTGEGATGGTAGHITPCEGVRVFGNYHPGSTGVKLSATGAGNSVSFAYIRAKVDRCYYGVYMEASNGAWVNGNTVNIDVAGCVYGWYLLSPSLGGNGVDGNFLTGQVQTTPQTEKVIYSEGSNNLHNLVQWDWASNRAGWPIAIDLRGSQNRLISNSLDRQYFASTNLTNVLETTQHRKPPRLDTIAPGGWFNTSFVGSQDDILLGADKRYTVTTTFGATSIFRMFDADPSSNVSCDDCDIGNPQSVTITFGSPITGIEAVGVHFGQARRPLHATLEVDMTGDGGWVALANRETTSNEFGIMAHTAVTGVSGGIHAIRVTFEGYAPEQSEVWISRIWAFSRNKPGSLLTQDVITGSRGGNEALASLLDALAKKGIIVDNTTSGS